MSYTICKTKILVELVCIQKKQHKALVYKINELDFCEIASNCHEISSSRKALFQSYLTNIKQLSKTTIVSDLKLVDMVFYKIAVKNRLSLKEYRASSDKCNKNWLKSAICM